MFKSYSHELKRAVNELKAHDQVCLLFEEQQACVDVVLQYIKTGLARGEQCVYIFTDENQQTAKENLSQLERELELLSRTEALVLLNKNEVGELTGGFTSDTIFNDYKNLVAKANQAGFTKIRIVEDMAWAAEKKVSNSNLLTFIAGLNQLLNNSPATGLFLYNRSQFSAAKLLDILKTHRRVIVNSELFNNAFYVPPGQYNTKQQAGYELDGLLSGLKNLKYWESDFLTAIKDLRGLVEINKTISGNLDINELGGEVLKNIDNHLKPAGAGILLFNRDQNMLSYQAASGFLSNHDFKAVKLDPQKALVGKTINEGRPLIVHDLWETDLLPEGAMLAGDDEKEFNAYYAFQLSAKGNVKGVLEVYLNAGKETEERWVPFLATLSNQLATMIQNAQEFESLQQKVVELTLAYDITISRMANAIDQRDNTISLYTQAVAEMTEKLARTMGANEDDLVHIRRGALLHYISKLSLPERILHKPGPLNEKEWEVVRQHPQIAYAMFSDIKLLKPALVIPFYRHEKWDGTGYPQGLKGDEIPLAARQFAVVDVYYALLTERPYRPPWDEIDVLEYIRSLSGTHFDPEVVDAFLEMVKYDA